MRALALIGLACGVGVHVLCAQVTANVEAGISNVEYDGFLPSAAASISPAVRWEHPRGRGFVSARGEQDHWHWPTLAQLATHVEAGQARQHHVEHHEVGRRPLGQLQRLVARVRQDRSMPLFTQ